MKKTIVKIKSDFKNDDIFCEVNGRAVELISAYIALTENLIETFSKEGIYGMGALHVLKTEAMQTFNNAGIFEKEEKNETK